VPAFFNARRKIFRRMGFHWVPYEPSWPTILMAKELLKWKRMHQNAIRWTAPHLNQNTDNYRGNETVSGG